MIYLYNEGRGGWGFGLHNVSNIPMQIENVNTLKYNFCIRTIEQ